MTHACVLLLAPADRLQGSFFQEAVCGLFWKIVFHRLHPELGTPASLQILELEEAHPVSGSRAIVRFQGGVSLSYTVRACLTIGRFPPLSLPAPHPGLCASVALKPS